jgi:hypothetical protein
MALLDVFRKKKPTPPEPLPSARCIILSRLHEPPDDDTVRNAWLRFPGASVRKENGAWLVAGPDLRAGAQFIPGPVPGGKAEQAAETPLWPNGPVEAVHRSHVAVGCKAEGGAVQQAFLLTAIASEMLNVFDGIAVYWPAGAVTVPREKFNAIFAFATPTQLPLELWCRFALFRLDDRHGGLHTIGMRQFGRMEVEIERSSWAPPELYALANDVANYILTSGTEVKHGDTVGKDAAQKIVVHHGRSTQLNDDVYKILAP